MLYRLRRYARRPRPRSFPLLLPEEDERRGTDGRTTGGINFVSARGVLSAASVINLAATIIRPRIFSGTSRDPERGKNATPPWKRLEPLSAAAAKKAPGRRLGLHLVDVSSVRLQERIVQTGA